ncbi:alginate O-acetyltransferase AlgX-related protein [Bosea rubneri]|uniref:GDSL-type esterase/lipase family protein n=1 Tax=Bosea rubneri TaxID=3075434 RepID=A0ABU3SDX0_9HYPH|nr:GDSL-type esterase/lipase family protein [Bosea sp. ZW T0_25]MDU0342997.1 GDSL-type esterase/lipase family protein [Bosea sp. ZW T0_25]
MSEKKRSRGREILINLAVSVGSILVFALFCELVLFRFLLPGSDVPRNAFSNGVVRYQPGQTGTWRVRDEIAAPFKINAQGWNSALPDYPIERRPGVSRIAFVGDSYVEALQVPFDATFAEKAVAALGPQGSVEGFRFGVAGAPLSQYLQMVEREVEQRRPDRIVVMLVHNDFDESFVFMPGRYTSSFLKLRVENGRVVGEVPPEPWRPGAFESLRQTATARFLLYRWQVRPQMLLDAILGPAQAAGEGGFAANIDVSGVLAREADIRVATDYLFGRLKARAEAVGAKLQLVMDGERQAVYAGRDSGALRLNRIAAEMAGRHGIPFLDLHPVFAADWARNQKRFDFRSDAHWNEYGHAVAGAAIAEALR